MFPPSEGAGSSRPGAKSFSTNDLRTIKFLLDKMPIYGILAIWGIEAEREGLSLPNKPDLSLLR